VAEICRRLDGIPLALELAAVRADALPVRELAARLDDALRLLTGGARTAPTRQQTLRAALDWSHALLAPAERDFFRALAVFAGTWTLAASEAVCAGHDGDDGPPYIPEADALESPNRSGRALAGGRRGGRPTGGAIACSSRCASTPPHTWP
jgi:predicted ATPase